MGKKRKNVQVIVVDTKSIQKEKDKPPCLGEKETYCRADFCGKDWFEQCDPD